jgi:hypothetical protein
MGSRTYVVLPGASHAGSEQIEQVDTSEGEVALAVFRVIEALRPTTARSLC